MNTEELKRILSDMRENNAFNMALDLLSDCVDAIDEQAKQIATLKAALIRERERYLDDFIYQDEPCEDRTAGAVLQLARELPDIDWSDVK